MASGSYLMIKAVNQELHQMLEDKLRISKDPHQKIHRHEFGNIVHYSRSS